jgi:hypothetical protein
MVIIAANITVMNQIATEPCWYLLVPDTKPSMTGFDKNRPFPVKTMDLKNCINRPFRELVYPERLHDGLQPTPTQRSAMH